MLGVEPAPLPVEGGSTDTLHELLLAVAGGDLAALAAVESRMGGLVRVNIRRVLRDASRSDSMAQEFFAGMVRDASDFDPDRDSAHSWVLAGAHRRASGGLASGQDVDP